MQKLKIIPIIVILASVFSLALGNPLERGKFIVKIEGLRNDLGDLRLAIYDKESNFLEDGGCYKKYVGKIQNGECVIETENIPYGEYAIGIMHDENKNGRIDFNSIKLPKEGFGFSNNPSVRIKKPSFNEAKINLAKPVKKIKIQAKYIF